MNRTIKFRAWDTTKNSWIKSDDVAILLHGGLLEADSYEYNYMHKNRVKNTILMQYTGLKDRSGKEIYESDIVNFIYGNNSNGVIEFVGYEWKIKVGKNKWISEPWSDIVGEEGATTEVLGNIYENPELLN